MIPRLFHAIWVQGGIPDTYRPWLDSWEALNPGWEHVLWSEADYLEYFDAETRDVYHWAGEQAPRDGVRYAQQADIANKTILERFGGVMMCADFECLRPIEAILEPDQPTCWWESPGQLSNTIVAAPAHHPAVQDAVKAIPGSVREQWATGRQINAGAGPIFIHREWAHRSDITIRDASEVYPYLWNQPKPDDYGDAYAVHYWTGSWVER